MDPLSVTASIITLITATGSVLQHLESVKSRMNPYAELLAIMNTVTDLQATLIVVRDENNALRDSRIPAARLAYNTLPDTIDKLQKRVNQLVDFAHANLLKHGKGLSRLGLSERRRKQLVEIRDGISEAHSNLRLVLLTANLRRSEVLLSTIEEAVMVQNENHTQTSAKLDRMIDQLTAIRNLRDDGPESSQCTQNSIRSVLTQTIHEDSDAMSTQLRITTSVPLKACDRTCNCQCHVRTQSQTPQWLSAVIGTLFYSSTNTPSLDVRPCNVTTCFRSQPLSSSRFTYYFPSWMMRAALVYSTWSNLEGKNSSWIVKMPNEISDYSPCWHYIQAGCVGKVRELLQSRQMSPFDIDADGVSVLHWAVEWWQLEICSLLMAMGADWHFKDRSGKSPSDGAWRKILRNSNSDPSVIKLRALVGSDDSYDLHLGPLHRIIVGLSSVDLQMQIELDPSRINDRDLFGMTPLMWAARRDNHTYLSILLSQGSQIGLRDSEGGTALHHAVGAGSLECVNTLLNAGADPNNADNIGVTPLHDVGPLITHPNIKNLVTLLHGHGANLEARDDNGMTPMSFATGFGSLEAVAALVECGADVNAFDCQSSPIGRAIFRGHANIVQFLAQCGIMSSWGPIHFGPENILESAAFHGTVEVMDTLSNSAAPPVECDVAKLKYWFNTFRNCFFGVRCSAEEELAAFHRLLDRKAIPLSHASGQEPDSPVGTDHALEDSDGCDNDEQDDDFEDAMENLSFFDEAVPSLVPPL